MLWQSIMDIMHAEEGCAVTVSMTLVVMLILPFGAWMYAYGFPERYFSNGEVDIFVSCPSAECLRACPGPKMPAQDRKCLLKVVKLAYSLVAGSCVMTIISLC